MVPQTNQGTPQQAGGTSNTVVAPILQRYTKLIGSVLDFLLSTGGGWSTMSIVALTILATRVQWTPLWVGFMSLVVQVSTSEEFLTNFVWHTGTGKRA